MKKRKLIILITIIVLALSFLSLIVFNKSGKKIIGGGFNRTWLSYSFHEKQKIELNASHIKIAGAHNNEIWLNNQSFVYIMDNSLSNYKVLNIGNQKFDSSIVLSARYPNIFFLSKNRRTVRTFNAINRNSKEYATVSQISKSITISDSCFVYKSFDLMTGNFFLIKQMNDSSSEPFYLYSKTGASGAFENNGRLIYDDKTGNILFVFAYHNGFMCIDTNLNLQYTAPTIDTVFKGSVKSFMKKMKNGRAYSLASPPISINRVCRANAGILFIESTLRSGNEQYGNSDYHIIDSYDILDGQYLGSFYVPNFENRSLADFYFVNEIFYAVHDNVVIKYEVINFSDH